MQMRERKTNKTMADNAQRLRRQEASQEELEGLENWLHQRPDRARKDKWLRLAVANHNLRAGAVAGARLLFNLLPDEKDCYVVMGKWKCLMAEEIFQMQSD